MFTQSTESSCPAGYTSEAVFTESFAESDDDVKKCNSCPNFEYDHDSGTYTCKLFNR